MNPWWQEQPLPVLPPHHRHLVAQIRRRLDAGLAPIVAVRGPRQVGKTTSQLQVLAAMLDEGVAPRRLMRVQIDALVALEQLGPDPVLRLVDWYEQQILGRTLNQAAHEGEPAVLFFDEVQNVLGWAPQLKALVDSSTTRVVITGSSALHIAQGHDSLAGRLTTIEAGVLSLTEIAMLRGTDLGAPQLADNGLGPLTRLERWRDLESYGRSVAPLRDATFAAFSERGGYPLGHARADATWEQVAEQLSENVIRRVIRHDLRSDGTADEADAIVLEEVFRLVCRYAGQCPSPSKLAVEAGRVFGTNLPESRVVGRIRQLADALLVRIIEPLEIRLQRKRGPAKLCLADHALRAAWLQELVPLHPAGLAARPDLATLAGHLAESTVGAVLSTIAGLGLAHLPERGGEPEVDFVLTVGTRRIPLEVKYQAAIDPVRDTRGLVRFMDRDRDRSSFGVLVTREDVGAGLGLDPRIVALPLSSLMLLR